MKIKSAFYIFFLLFSPASTALPKFTLIFGESKQGFTQVKIKNETLTALACFVAIDGYQKKFQLRAKSTSDWITSTDSRFNYQHFKTWCDYLDLNPNYRLYPLY
ncbi:hypothetical protein SAMN05216262_10959 [Colwellia chukchiensis]|uniref:Uncharacterized protein n=1 Tax=Colwellia chukchiensis TaxID=641665 RepID=A0A1H7PCL4_9GAMM|nr:hypothetical protein [Colwellia chukchiensis]SEL33015.1 hypothetical protein SAMN05216262_10959 [Colwellia chukchiensis]